jgi:hypothetical protein
MDLGFPLQDSPERGRKSNMAFVEAPSTESSTAQETESHRSLGASDRNLPWCCGQAARLKSSSCQTYFT